MCAVDKRGNTFCSSFPLDTTQPIALLFPVEEVHIVKFRLIDDLVLIRRDPKEEVSRGIAIPQQYQKDTTWGTVIAVGPGRLAGGGHDGKEDCKVCKARGVRIPMQVKEGERVAFLAHVGNEVELDGVKYVEMGQNQLLGVLE